MPAPITAAAFAQLPTKAQLARVEKLVRQALPLYGLSPDSGVKLLSYSENATYLVRPPGGPRRVLRINRPGYHPRANIASELAWVQAIRRDTPIVTAEPIPSLDGEYIQLVWHPAVPGRYYLSISPQSMSFGCAELEPGMGAIELLEAADGALRARKSAR